jgi:hypothetical protein
MKRILLLCLVVLMFVAVLPVLAQQPVITATSPITGTTPYPPPVAPPVSIPQLKDILGKLANGLLGGIVVAAMAFVFERIAVFKALSPRAKGAIVFAVLVFSPLLGRVLLDIAPPTLWPAIEPYWQALAIGIVGYAGSQWWYLTVIEPAKS